MSNLEKHVEDLLEKASKTTESNDALKFSQAAVNAANAISALRTMK